MSELDNDSLTLIRKDLLVRYVVDEVNEGEGIPRVIGLKASPKIQTDGRRPISDIQKDYPGPVGNPLLRFPFR
ncbi:hypothetical protein TNCV_580871 [Trichonephila clavipes]|nr:hypothetical protein TNCV_580871 [Trichonephila clavipes]